DDRAAQADRARPPRGDDERQGKSHRRGARHQPRRFPVPRETAHSRRLLTTLRAALELSRTLAENRRLHEALGHADPLVGVSPAMEEVRALIARVAPTEARVLITGESGTGKELVASAIHRQSGRAAKRFVCVNSAAIPKDLVESEMFGHERGAFTGATERRVGRFELADSGTLFLDEVGDLSLDAQAKLLRVLETGVSE